MCSFAETTHTPQGDGNPNCTAYIADNYLETTHTPQGDGNNVFLAFVCFLPLKQPTPRKGTETVNPLKFSRLNTETTHTPQGDGNPVYPACAITFLRNNPHPARGRKLVAILNGLFRGFTKRSTPRKGTENHLCLHCRNCWRNHSHPRQGTTDKKERETR